ncbi:SDR family oxidoreductase [Vibrio astriarenae]|uniref:SDR family oxidoreductase n=1 Tax=Vibrio astriarenae TaxID=1481923 RepID=UPI0037352FD3
MNIAQAVILVTAAGTMLGRTLAQHFALQGASVVITDTNESALNNTLTLCVAHTPNVYAHVMECQSIEANNALFDFVEHTNAQAPNIVVNLCTGFPNTDALEQTDSDTFVQQLAKATGSLLNLGKVAAERMKPHQQEGVIINIISDGQVGTLMGGDSASSIVAGFTKRWASELNPFNIRVGGIVPAPRVNYSDSHIAASQDELVRHTEYIVANDYFNGRVMSAEF